MGGNLCNLDELFVLFMASSIDFNLYTHSCYLSLSYQARTHEQAHSEKLASEVEKLSQKLQRSEAELHSAKDSVRQSQERVEFLSHCLKKSESLQPEKRRGSAEVNNTSNSNSESTDTRDVSPSDQNPEAAKGCDLSVTRAHSTGESERQLSERVTELAKEVCTFLVFAGCLCSSVQLPCKGDDLCYVEILALGMLDDYQLTVGPLPRVQHFISKTSALSLLISFKMSPRLLLIFLISSAAFLLKLLLSLSHAHTCTLNIKQRGALPSSPRSQISPSVVLSLCVIASVLSGFVQWISVDRLRDKYMRANSWSHLN